MSLPIERGNLVQICHQPASFKPYFLVNLNGGYLITRDTVLAGGFFFKENRLELAALMVLRYKSY